MAGQRAVGAIVIVVVLPLPQALGEQVGVVDNLTFEEAIELAGVDTVGTLDLPVQPGRSGPDPHVPDTLVEQVPQWKAEPIFLPVVRLHLLDLERQFRQHVVDELNRGPLIVTPVGTQNPQAVKSREVVCEVLA